MATTQKVAADLKAAELAYATKTPVRGGWEYKASGYKVSKLTRGIVCVQYQPAKGEQNVQWVERLQEAQAVLERAGYVTNLTKAALLLVASNA